MFLRVRFVRSACAYPDRNALVAQGARCSCVALGLLYRPMSGCTDSWAPLLQRRQLNAREWPHLSIALMGRSAMDEYRRAQTFSLCTLRLCALCVEFGFGDRPCERVMCLEKLNPIGRLHRHSPLFRMQWQPFSVARASPALRAPMQGLSASEGSAFSVSQKQLRE